MHLTSPIQSSTEFVGSTIRQEQDLKRVQTRKRGPKILLKDSIIVYMENLKKYTMSEQRYLAYKENTLKLILVIKNTNYILTSMIYNSFPM